MRRNAIILAAGTSSRFVPLSQEVPKGLLEVKGEILIERQIRQLKEAGVNDICVVVGYKAEKFHYLKEKFGVDLVYNEDYARYNNTSSMIRVLDRLDNTFICSSDNYFPDNVFRRNSTTSYYSALYTSGETSEYCIHTDTDDNITNVEVGGSDSWYMVGHVYFSHDFSKMFRDLLMTEYEREDVRNGYWEDIFITHIGILPAMKINRYGENEIFEFDTLDELREFDSSYLDDTRSEILKQISESLGCGERELKSFKKISASNDRLRFSFQRNAEEYVFDSKEDSLTRI